MDSDERLTQLDAVAEHIGRAYDTLFELGYTEQANVLLEMLDDIGDEMGNLEAEIDK